MDLAIILFGFAFAALAMFLLSAGFLWKKKHKAGSIFALLELLSATISSSAWVYALWISGFETFLFGIRVQRYTPIALICICMFAVGAVCFILNVRGLAKQNAAYTRVAQA